MMKQGLILLLVMVCAALLFDRQTMAEAPKAEVNCVSLVSGMIGSPDRQLKATGKGAAPAIENWMTEQVGQGKSNFLPVPTGGGDLTTLCAW